MKICTLKICFNEKQARDLRYMAAVRGMDPHAFVRYQLALDGIELLPDWVLADISRGCIGRNCRGLASCDRCRRQRFLGRRAGICYDCLTRSATACDKSEHDRLASQLGPDGDRYWCAACGAALRYPEADFPVCAQTRDTWRIEVATSNGEDATVLEPATDDRSEVPIPVRSRRRGVFEAFEEKPFDCGNDEESFLENDLYVTIRLRREHAIAVELMAAFQGMTPEEFVRRQIGLFRFDSCPDWMRADAAQGCVSCASWRDCPRCGARGLLGGGAEHCANCAASGVDPCGDACHAAFAEITAIRVEDEDGTYRCMLCNAVFEVHKIGERVFDAHRQTDHTDTRVQGRSAPASRSRWSSATGRRSTRRGRTASPEDQASDPGIVEIELNFDEGHALERGLRQLWRSNQWMVAARIAYGHKGSLEYFVRGNRADLATLANVLQDLTAAVDASGSTAEAGVGSLISAWSHDRVIEKLRDASATPDVD